MAPQTSSPIMPISRFAGVAPQFERAGDGYHFRRGGHGPAVRVSAAERDAFVAAGMRSLLLHAAALPVFGLAAWLLLDRLLGATSGSLAAALFGVALSLIAMALYASLRWHADAPSRVLAARPAERPARDPDLGSRHSYAAILGLTLFLLALAGMGARQPAPFYVAFASASVMLGLFLAARRWRFHRSLDPRQRQRAKAIEAQAAAANTRLTPGRAVLLIVFVLVELAVMGMAVFAVIAAAIAVVGQTSDTMTFGPFMAGFVGGIVLAVFLVRPVDRLCRRWTGTSALQAFEAIPAGW